MSGDTTHYCPECVRLALRLADAEIALHLIAAPMRPDGSWNRDRKACQLMIPARVDRLRALGNALVPQIAEWIGARILEHETATREVSA